MRLDKLLADMNIGSRKDLKALIRSGEVSVDGMPVKDPGMAVTGEEKILVRGQPVRYAAFEYYMLNKPAGVLSATEDPKQPTVLDLLGENRRRDLFPVGRLDKDTVGLLLITNDGELAHRLLSPKHHIDKTYFARVCGEVTGEDILAFREGLFVDEELTALPAELKVLNVLSDMSRGTAKEKQDTDGRNADDGDSQKKDVISEVEVTIREGKFHQIKRMFAARGMEVVYLKRLSMGTLTLDSTLPEGAFRPLSEDEISVLKHMAGCYT